jgi:cbb3-type cytochrome oxidase subunit 3
MAKKAENILLSFKFLATAAGLWWAWNNHKKKEALAEAQLLALQEQPRTATTPLSISTGERLPSQQTIVMQGRGDSQLQEAQPTRPLDQLVNAGGNALIEQLQKINI